MANEMPGKNLLGRHGSSPAMPAVVTNSVVHDGNEKIPNEDTLYHHHFDVQNEQFLTKRGKKIHHVVRRVFVITDGVYLTDFSSFLSKY